MTPLPINGRLPSALLFIAAISVSGIGNAAGSSSFSGKVLATNSARETVGAPELTVTLTPPTRLNKPKQVTVTDGEGRFRLNEVEDGQYLLEVFQRLKVLYRELITVPQAGEKEILLNPDIDGLISELDGEDAQARLKPVNTLAFDKHYATAEVVGAILQRIESESIKPLSMQGEINCLVILARRASDPWRPEHVARAKAILQSMGTRELTDKQRWAANELNQAVSRIRQVPP